jgi:hypothetical protein
MLLARRNFNFIIGVYSEIFIPLLVLIFNPCLLIEKLSPLLRKASVVTILKKRPELQLLITDLSDNVYFPQT